MPYWEASPSLRRWLGLITTFVAGQGSLQIIQLVSGILLLRWLTVEEYAQYSMAYAFQHTAKTLVEFGFSGSIVALVGKRIHDKQVVGRYIKTGKFFRDRSFIIISIGCLIVFPYLALKQGWDHETIAWLTGGIIGFLFFSGWISYYSPPLKMHQKIGTIYRIQLKGGVLRFLGLAAMHFSSVLNGWLAVFAGTFMTVFNGYSMKRESGAIVEEPAKAGEAEQKEMWKYVSPLIPGILFYAFQGQILILIISVFGNTSGIAEMGALGRLAQLFSILNTGSVMLVAPFIARQDARGLLKKYLFIMAIGVAISLVLIAFSLIFPEPLLWVMGPRYSHLQTEVSLLILNSSLIFLSGLMWQMNAARKWIYPWMPMIIIPGTIVLQVSCASLMDLSSTYNVLLFSLFSITFNLIVRTGITIYGFTYSNQPE